MPWTEFAIGALASLVLGLDRTAAFQLMISRPIVAGPLTGFLVGQPFLGLQVGALVELLWLGKLPVGATILPDDTQVTISAAVLVTAAAENFLAIDHTALVIFCVLVAMPLGRIGQFFDRKARQYNGRLIEKVERDLKAGNLNHFERIHLRGIIHFGAAAVLTYLGIILPGWVLVRVFGENLLLAIDKMEGWLLLAFPLVGTAVILSTIKVSRSLTLFTASFSTALLLLWLL